LVVRDLGSRNGTYLDGKLIHDGVLSPGRVLHIGEVRVVMALEPNS
jgi:pSer/pThr/pTyr-binding forkhead associated (FHA) protein